MPTCFRSLVLSAAALGLGLATPLSAQIIKKCPPDSVKVGNACVDTYEASVWQVPEATSKNRSLVKKIQRGKATLAMLQAAGAIQLGCAFAPFDHADYPPEFPLSGNWMPLPGSSPPTPGLYALSIPGVLPSTCITQLQAGQACALAGKRLVTGAEWQLAAAGTPDPGALDDDATTCATSGSGPATTGSRSACVSSWGARDMVGNVWEWVADAADRNASSCTHFPPLLGDDLSCFGGDGVDPFDRMPAGVIRGGQYGSASDAGVFAVSSAALAWDGGLVTVGFRCAR